MARGMCAKHYGRWQRNGHPGKQDTWANEFDGTGSKRCSKCRAVKPRTEFHRNKQRRDGLTPQCSECVHQQHEETYPIRREKLLRQERLRRARKLGLSAEEYDALVEAHGGRCAICKGSSSTGQRGLHLDHDHSTGKARGFLCSPCNVSIGHFRDDPVRLRQAALYIELYRS